MHHKKRKQLMKNRTIHKHITEQIHTPKWALPVLIFFWMWRRQTAHLKISTSSDVFWRANLADKVNYKLQMDFFGHANFSHDSSDEQGPQLQLGSQSSLHLNICQNEIELLNNFFHNFLIIIPMSARTLIQKVYT